MKYKDIETEVSELISRYGDKFVLIKPGKMSSNYLSDGVEFVIKPTFPISQTAYKSWKSAKRTTNSDGTIKISGFLDDVTFLLNSM